MGFRTVVLDTPCRCTYQGGYLVVRQEDRQPRVHLGEISSIMLGTEQIFLSAYLLAELAKLKIPVIVTDEKHNPVGEYLPLYGAHNCSKCMLEQLAWGEVIKNRYGGASCNIKFCNKVPCLLILATRMQRKH